MGPKRKSPTPANMQFVAEIYERHKGIMYKTALECLGSDEDRDTEKDAVVHDALLRMTEHTDTLARLSEMALAVYVAATVRSVALDKARRRSVELRHTVDAEALDLDGYGADPGHEALYIEAEAHRDRLRYLREALGEVDETDRRLLVGKYLAGESDQELARSLGVKPESVRMKLTRAKRRVRGIIERKEAGL